MIDKRPILIAGPTASGKSALVLALAEQFGGVVINADSMQVYRELCVLTARPSADDEGRAPHRLYGHVAGADAYSAARYAAESREAIAAAQAAGAIPIIVGGTGLYFKALTDGLSPIPPIPEEIRAYWRNRASEEGAAALHAILAERDPEMASRLRPTDPQRLVRALEVLEATGISLARWQEQPGEPAVILEEARAFVVSWEREEMRRRCDARFDLMMRQGALEEVRALLQLGLSPELPVMRALGVRPLADLIRGKLSPTEATEAAKAETRQYVKRQTTWLNSNMRTWNWLSAQEMKNLIENPASFVQFVS